MFMEPLQRLNDFRLRAGYLTIDEILELSRTNTIFDPFSVLISRGVGMGADNVIHPAVRIETGGGSIELGDGNVLFSGTVIAAARGAIAIGDGNELGEGGICIRADSGSIRVSDGTRLRNGPEILDGTDIGAGCQILGNIKVKGCMLEAGEPYTASDPNERGAVLKGYGFAANIRVGRGSVIFGKGDFDEFPIELQEKYHPGWRADPGKV